MIQKSATKKEKMNQHFVNFLYHIIVHSHLYNYFPLSNRFHNCLNHSQQNDTFRQSYYCRGTNEALLDRRKQEAAISPEIFNIRQRKGGGRRKNRSFRLQTAG